MRVRVFSIAKDMLQLYFVEKVGLQELMVIHLMYKEARGEVKQASSSVELHRHAFKLDILLFVIFQFISTAQYE